MPIMPPSQLPLNRSMGNNYGRVNPANSRANAQAATYTSNVTGAQTAGGYNGALAPNQQQGMRDALNRYSGGGGARNLPSINPEVQAMRDWMAGRQPQPQQGGRDAYYRYGVDDQGGPAQTMEWNEARDRRTGDDAMQLASQQQSAVFQPQQVLKQYPQTPQILDIMRGLGGRAVEGAGQIVGGVGRTGSSLGERVFGGQQPQSAVNQPEMSNASIADYMGSQPQQQQIQPWVSRGADQARQGGAPMAKGEMDSLQARLADAEQQAAEARHQRTYREHAANVQDWLGGRLAGDQIAAAQGGSQDHNIARGRGTPQQEAAFQSQLGQAQNRDANREFAMTPGGEQMDRFLQLAAMQSNVHQPQQGGIGQSGQGEDTQANVRAYGEDRRYANRVMKTGRWFHPEGAENFVEGQPELALTSPGNVNRPGGPISTGDITGQMDHKGQSIHAATAPRNRDAAARNRERINRRRAERGGMSERQARDISRRARNPKALEAYAIRNGLENNAMVQSMLSGQGPSAVHGSQGAGSYPTTPTPESSARAAADARKEYPKSKELQAFGVEPGGDWRGYSGRFTKMFEDGHGMTDKELTAIHGQLTKDNQNPKFWDISMSDSTQSRTGHNSIKSFLDANTPEERRKWLEGFQDQSHEQFSTDPEAGWLDPLWEMYGG